MRQINTQSNLKKNIKHIIPLIMILIGLTIILIDGVNASNNNEYLIDSVNIGDIIDENNHDLISWGPIVKPTGSSWGGGDDGNLRTVWYYEQEKAIGIWHLDENNGLITYDSSNNNYNGKIDGATWDSGKKVNSLYFNGINNSIDFGDITKIDGSKELSISLWVKVDNLSKDLDILSKDIHDWNSQLLLWRDETGTVTGNKDTFSIVVSDGYNEARIEGESNACSDNNWHHICIIFKANDQQGLRLFIDGIEDNNSPVSTLNINRLNSNSNSLLVGKSIDKGKYFNGNIDEICIWGFVLTLQEIEDLFNENIDPYSIVRNLDEPWSSLKMMINNDYVGSRLEIRALDGIADDSFVVYINNNKIYDYADQASTETWITHNIDISNYDITGLITIKILSTSDEWQHFETYGQLGISWLRLYACENGIITTINFRNSNDEPISGGFVEYHDQEWIEFGITDNQGKVNKTLDEGKYSFRIKYYDAYNKIRQDIRKNPIVNFSTKNVSVKFVDSMGLPLPGGNVSLNSGGWKDLGVTGDNGLVFGEFLARKYTFRLCYDGSCISKRQDINDDPLVVFSTVNVTVRFLDSNSNPISDADVSYNSDGWKSIGLTNKSGETTVELIPRKYSFKVSYNNESQTIRQNINDNPLVVFSTVNVTVRFLDSNSNPISDADVSYNSDGWKSIGLTNKSGETTVELIPRKYTFRIKYYDAYNKIRQDIRKNPIVNFSTKNVSVKFVDSMGLPLPGGNVSLNSGGWKDLGVTGDNGLVFGEFLARKYTFRLCYDGSCISKRQDINDDPLVVFTTLNVTIKFLDNTSYPIENGEVLYYSGGWKLIGYTNDEGKIDKELLPRKYLFKINYNNQKYKKRQNINENSTVIIKPNFKINRKPISIPGGPYKSLINEDIYFNGSKSYDPDGKITNYTWYFDDGNISYGKKTIHNYSKTGSYIIKLKVKDDKGETKSNFTFANITIDIKTTDKDDNNGFNNQIEQNTNKNSNSGSNKPIIFNYVEKNDQTKNENNEEESKKSNDNNKPVAVITGPIKAKKDEILTFDASESYDIDYDELEFRWDYNNDGIWDTEYTKNPQNSYVWKKDYNGQVILEVSDGKGGFDQTSYSIKVEGSIEDIEQLYSSQTNEQDIKLQIPYCILTIISLLIIIFTVIVFRKKFYKK